MTLLNQLTLMTSSGVNVGRLQSMEELPMGDEYSSASPWKTILRIYQSMKIDFETYLDSALTCFFKVLNKNIKIIQREINK